MLVNSVCVGVCVCGCGWVSECGGKELKEGKVSEEGE